jgi:hypothetical protein
MTTTNAVLQNQITEINSSLNELHSIIDADTNDKNELLKQQNKIKAIVKKEKQNLENTERRYQENSDTQKRQIALTKNSSLRMQQYNYFTFIVVFAILSLLLLSLLEKHFPIFPSVFLIILRIIVIAVGFIWGYNVLSEIDKRDPLNYNKLNLEKPKIDSPETIEKKRKVAEKEGDLLGSVGQLTCSGEDCCDVGTKWDSEKMLCVPIEESFDNIRPNEPNNNFAKL